MANALKPEEAEVAVFSSAAPKEALPELTPKPAEVADSSHGVGQLAGDSRGKLAQLFDHLKIAKIVFVDDKAKPLIDAGAVIRVLAAKPEASEALAPFFVGVALTLENDALLEQIALRLAELNDDKQAELRTTLSAQGENATEREALGRLKDLLPDGTATHLLTPLAWFEQRADLIKECSEERRTLFLFDQELEVDDASLDFHKGSDIIRDMAEKERAGFGTRWFCGMLTHTVEKGDEVAAWRRLEKSEKLDLRFFMPIAKSTLDDAPAFYGAVYRTLINTYCQAMKGLAADAFEEALKEALERFSNLDPIDFEHMVVKSSETEGVSELETLIRLYGIIQKDQVKTQILQKARVGEFSAAALTVKGIADIGRELSATSQERLCTLRKEELYEGDQLVNGYNDPLRNGDVFEIGEGSEIKLWVLIAQPCDIMVRSNGERARENNFKVAVLARLHIPEPEDAPESSDDLCFSLDHYDHNGARPAFVQFAHATPANLHVLDLAVLNKDGRCQLNSVPDENLKLPSRAWEQRDQTLRKYFERVTRQIEGARTAHNDKVADLLAAAVIPRASPKKAFANLGTYDKGSYTYPIRRRDRIRDPLATSLLSAFSRYLARDARAHDYSRASR